LAVRVKTVSYATPEEGEILSYRVIGRIGDVE